MVVIGVGGIGQAIARRQGAGMIVSVADVNEQALHDAALETTGCVVSTLPVDVSSRESVHALANAVAQLGNVMQVVHTAGLSPNMASSEKILAVDLLGMVLVLEEFGWVVAPGGAGIFISSMAGYMPPPFGQELDEALARTPADQLLNLPSQQPAAVSDSGAAYGLSKRANYLRVQGRSISVQLSIEP